jgi:hypothetical protein
METAEILALFDQEERINKEYPDMRKEVLPHVVRFVRPGPGMSFILYSNVDEHNADQVIEEQIAYFRPHDGPFSWDHYDHDSPPDLLERLRAHGFQPDEDGAVMVLDLQDAPAELLEPRQAGADVRHLTDLAQLEDVIAIESQVWGSSFDWMRQRFAGHLAIPGYLSIYIAYVDNVPVCAGWTFYQPNGRFAGLYGGSTVEKYRKQGLYTAVLAIRVQEAIERGYRFLTIDASPMSEPIVAKHGFRLLTRTRSCYYKQEEEGNS